MYTSDIFKEYLRQTRIVDDNTKRRMIWPFRGPQITYQTDT